MKFSDLGGELSAHLATRTLPCICGCVNEIFEDFQLFETGDITQRRSYQNFSDILGIKDLHLMPLSPHMLLDSSNHQSNVTATVPVHASFTFAAELLQ